MPSAEKIIALRGMRDVFSAEYAKQRRLRGTLERYLLSFAYVPIDLPILENTELYLRKSGEAIAERLYEFNFKSRRIALRPELTASVLRAYVEHLQEEPLPLRIQYSGPVFRYEKPQQNRFRQFTLTGAEMIGAAGATADAEILHVACSGLEKLGVGPLKLIIGHTDVLEGFLRSLGLRKQLLNFLLRNMENIRKRGMDFVIESLREVYPELAFTAADLKASAAGNAPKSQQLITVLREMADEDAQQAITDFLHSLNIHIDSNRDEREVIDRLLHKIREDEQAPKLRKALDYMQRLSSLAGAPEQVMQRAGELFDEFGVDPQPLQALQTVLAKLSLFGELDAAVELDFGLNRGLHYYTGLMFEIRCSSENGDEIQLCGGGRYDNLVSVLGGNATTPALGFAYGIERIASVLDMGNGHSLHRPDLIIIPIAEDDFAFANAVAGRLREREKIVELSIDERNLRRSLKYANRKGARLVIIIGEKERAQGQIVLRDMRNHREVQVASAEIEAVVERLLAENE